MCYFYKHPTRLLFVLRRIFTAVGIEDVGVPAADRKKKKHASVVEARRVCLCDPDLVKSNVSLPGL